MELARRTESLSEVPHSVLFQRHPFVPVQEKRRRELQLFPEYFQILKKYIFFSCNYLDVSDKFGGVILVQIVLIIIPILLDMNSQTLLKIQSKRKCCQQAGCIVQSAGK